MGLFLITFGSFNLCVYLPPTQNDLANRIILCNQFRWCSICGILIFFIIFQAYLYANKYLYIWSSFVLIIFGESGLRDYLLPFMDINASEREMEAEWRFHFISNYGDFGHMHESYMELCGENPTVVVRSIKGGLDDIRKRIWSGKLWEGGGEINRLMMVLGICFAVAAHDVRGGLRLGI